MTRQSDGAGHSGVNNDFTHRHWYGMGKHRESTHKRQIRDREHDDVPSSLSATDEITNDTNLHVRETFLPAMHAATANCPGRFPPFRRIWLRNSPLTGHSAPTALDSMTACFASPGCHNPALLFSQVGKLAAPAAQAQKQWLGCILQLGHPAVVTGFADFVEAKGIKFYLGSRLFVGAVIELPVKRHRRIRLELLQEPFRKHMFVRGARCCRPADDAIPTL